MEEKEMTKAQLDDKRTDTGSLSTLPIFGLPVLDKFSAMDGEKSVHDGDQPKPRFEKDATDGEEVATAVQDIIPQGFSEDRGNAVGGGTNGVTNTTSVRIPYNNGYGDFFFGRLSWWDRPKIPEDISEEEKQELMGITGSSGVPVVELDGFQRSGPFPYTKLPFEIREKIIRILLQPVLSTYHNGHAEVEFTRFELASLRDPFDDDNLNYGDEDLYYASEKKAEREYEAMLYPGRKYLYDLTLFPVRSKYGKGPMRDWLFLRWLRQASYVSTSFRYELARVLWSHTVISAGDEYEDAFKDRDDDDDDEYYRNRALGEISTLIMERPEIIPGIKTLNLTLLIARGQDIENFTPFSSMCDTVAESLDLEGVYLTIKASEEDLERLLEGKNCALDSLEATTKFQVSTYFDVELKRVYDSDDEHDTDDELNPEYVDTLLELMMPLSLRDREPETEEEKYLQARVEEFGEAEETSEFGETEEPESAEADVETEED